MVQAKQMAQAVQGAVQTAQGQGNQDSAASTGTAIAGLMKQAA
jgi:hypothetical protein